MAIPFYENEEHLQTQQHNSEEIDQVDGHVMPSQNVTPIAGFNGPSGSAAEESSPVTVDQQDFMAWKVLAVAMCKALKDHYQQNMTSSGSSANAAAWTNSSSTAADTQTAVIQILPNGQLKPHWN